MATDILLTDVFLFLLVSVIILVGVFLRTPVFVVLGGFLGAILVFALLPISVMTAFLSVFFIGISITGGLYA